MLEVAFEGLQRSTRHKSGLAMRFPRISRLRWDKPPREADRLETLEKHAAKIEAGRAARPRGLLRRRNVALRPEARIVDAEGLPAKLEPGEPPMANDTMTRFFGGSPLSVIVRLVLLSILVGVILSALGLDPVRHHRAASSG